MVKIRHKRKKKKILRGPPFLIKIVIRELKWKALFGAQKKKKKKAAQLPSGLILGGWVCVPAPSCLLAGNLLFRRATRLGFSLSFLQLFFSFPCACWRWLELCCFLGTDAEGRKDRDQISSVFHSRAALPCFPQIILCCLWGAKKEKKKKKTNKQTKEKCSETDSHSCVFKLFQLFLALPASPRERQSEAEYNSQRDTARERERERIQFRAFCCDLLLLLVALSS